MKFNFYLFKKTTSSEPTVGGTDRDKRGSLAVTQINGKNGRLYAIGRSGRIIEVSGQYAGIYDTITDALNDTPLDRRKKGMTFLIKDDKEGYVDYYFEDDLTVLVRKVNGLRTDLLNIDTPNILTETDLSGKAVLLSHGKKASISNLLKQGVVGARNYVANSSLELGIPGDWVVSGDVTVEKDDEFGDMIFFRKKVNEDSIIIPLYKKPTDALVLTVRGKKKSSVVNMVFELWVKQPDSTYHRIPYGIEINNYELYKSGSAWFYSESTAPIDAHAFIKVKFKDSEPAGASVLFHELMVSMQHSDYMLSPYEVEKNHRVL